jgi:hypothetical protein
MSKEEVLSALETTFNDPGSFKSGEYLEEHVLLYARQFLHTDRLGLVDALCSWIILKNEPRTMLAVRIAKELGLQELRQVIEMLRHEVAAGKVFPKYYLRDLDEALSTLV